MSNATLQLALRLLLPAALLTLCLWMLAQRLEPGVSGAIWAHVVQVRPTIWALALGLSMASLWAVGRYDSVAHRHLGTQVRDRPARIAGTASIALAQTLGVGVISGALARWRLLADLSLGEALRLSAFVSVSFIAGWAAVTALACLLLPAPDWTFWPALAGLAVAAVVVGLQFFCPVLRLRSRQVHLPTLPASGAILLWTAVDTVCAAGALYVLLPAGADVSPAQFLPLFLLALGTALISNTPGGVGPFELMMLGLMPHLPAADVLGSIVAFRLIYYALPALLAAVALARPLKNTRTIPPAPVPLAVSAAWPAELGVMRQNGAQAVSRHGATLALWPTAQTLTALGDPLAGRTETGLNTLRCLARSQSRLPALYKCGARKAATARRAGWAVMHIADEALIATDRYDTSRPAFRRLRRKLRAAEKSGVVVSYTRALPLAEMARVDAAWQASHGRARGGTMGQFETGYVGTQHCFLAHVHGRLVGYVTFHSGLDDWCLDLVRHVDDLPDGSMFALVDAAICAARATGIAQVSLAAIPACPKSSGRLWHWIGTQMVTRGGGSGLRQFKSSFAPRWQPAYAAAPNWPVLTLALADITRAVHLPAKPVAAKAHDRDENYEVASRRTS
jgi:phosphatidylglycerol lysyltransferase